MKRTIREITTSFCITIIIVGVVFILGLAHYRMQNTIYASDYTLIELYRVSQNQLDVIFDNTLFTVDLTNLNETWESLTKFEIFVPVTIKIISNSVVMIVEFVVEGIQSLDLV